MKVLETDVVSKIGGLKWDEVIKGLSNLNNEEPTHFSA
jgi:hypothetical protein